MLCIRYHTPFPTAVIYAFPWRRNARLFLTAFFIFIAQSSFTGPKRGVFPPQFLLGNYSIQIIYCCQDLFPGIQPKWSFPLLSFTPLLLLQQITGMWKCIKWRHFFPKCFSYTQEFTKSKTLILTFFFALGTGVCISQQKVDVNCNKKYLSLAYSQLIGEGLGRFRFFFLLKSVRFVKSTGLHSLETGAFICCKGSVQSSRMFSSLTSADWHHLQSSHRIGTTAFSRQKLILTDAVRRGLISHLLPCYLSWQSTGHICAHSSILEILRVTAHFRRPLCPSVRLCAKNLIL